MGVGVAAEAGVGLVEGDVGGALQDVGGREPGDPAADDGDVPAPRVRAVGRPPAALASNHPKPQRASSDTSFASLTSDVFTRAFAGQRRKVRQM